MSEQPREFTISLLPCNSINQTLDFYKSLGFEVTYQQKKPNVYADIKLRDLELHFFVIKEHKPQNNYSTCYLVVIDVDSMYQSFRSGVKNLLGKIPLKGVPRINPLKDMPFDGVRQFIVVDPSGNYIRIGQPIQKVDSLVYTENNKNEIPATSGSALEKAFEFSSRLADAKGDFGAAAKVLDKAMASEKRPDPNHLFRVLILRAHIAIRMEEYDLANQTILNVDKLILEVDRKTLKEEFRLLKEIRTML